MSILHCQLNRCRCQSSIETSTPLGSYDLDEVHMLFNAAQASLMTWDDAMQRVSCDSIRLALIDVSSMFQAPYVETFDRLWMTPGFQFCYISMQLPHSRCLPLKSNTCTNHIVASRFAWREPLQLQVSWCNMLIRQCSWVTA